MARVSTLDPLDKFRWLVDIPGFNRVGFTSTQVPSMVVNTNDYAEGGSHLNPKKIVDGVTYKPITLSRGVTTDPGFSKWAAGFMDLVTNNAVSKNTSFDSSNILDSVANIAQAALGYNPIPFSSSIPFSYRKNIKIYHVNRLGQVQVVYNIYNAFPIEYVPASDFEAGEEGISIEKLTLGYEGFDVSYSPVLGSAGSFIG